MSRTLKILSMTGAALSLSTTAMAQNADLDIDRAYAAELKADASRHASLLQGGGSGYDGAFHIGDASGNNRLNVNGHLATRYIMNFTDEDDSAALGEGFTNGFEQQYATLSFNGNVVNPQITYNISFELGQADRDESLSILRDAWGQYEFEGEGEGFYVRWGQFQVPILNEENIHNGKQLAVSRGPVNEFFNPSWSEGIMVGYLSDSFAVHGALTDGIRTPITAWGATAGTPFSGSDADFAITGRADVKFSGAWEQFDDFTSFRGSDTALKVGGGFHYETGGDTGQVGGVMGKTSDVDYWMWTIDAQLEGDGWNVAAGYVGHTVDVTGGIDVTQHGVYVQGGVFLTDQWEAFGRWDFLAMDEDFTGTGDEEFHFLTVGTNYYFVPESHAVKFTGDVIYALDDSLAGIGGTSTNQGDTGLLLGTNGELSVRLQMSILF
ncbi:MAG: hypothetical protein DHS20C14_14220 [Phycisphaeraceae bacterium]|nr:MAG: hypothetical protein DHS20C14_14220 [Phycisphaeraceae bacterium]